MDKSRKIRKVLLLTLGLNAGVAAAKIAYGYLIGSISMTADGFHSFFDGASNVIGLAGIWMASRPPDENHAYGHKKYETLSTVAISVMMFLTSIEILKRVFQNLSGAKGPEVEPGGFVVMIVTLFVNIGVSRYERRRGVELGSDFLLADAMHTKSDIYTTLAVIASLIGARMGYPALDPLAAVFITVMIGRMGYEILRSASDILTDAVAFDSDLICRAALGVDGVIDCHEVRTRGRKDHVHVDLHVIVSRDMTTGAAHDVAHAVADRLKATFPELADVVVHIEPQGHVEP